MANTTKAFKLPVHPGANEPVRLNMPVAAAIILYHGAALVMADGANAAKKPSNTAGERFIGFCGANKIDNSGGAAGDLRVDVLQPDFFSPNAWSVTPAATEIGKDYFWQDDQTLGLTPTVNYAGTLSYIDKNSTPWIDARHAYGKSGAGRQEVITLPLQLLDLAAGTFKRVIPYAFTLISTLFRTAKAATTAAKAATLTPDISGTPVTGGVMALTSANQNTIGGTVAGTAVTAANTGTAGQTLGVTASAVTAFVEGDGWVEFTIQRND